MKINKVSTGRYRPLTKELAFMTDREEILIINSNVALEIAYTLFDMFGMNYKSLEELEEKMKGEN